MNAIIVSPEEFADAQENYVGWCTACESFTREGTEPDAESYDCPQCEQDTVMGAEQAMLEGKIEVQE